MHAGIPPLVNSSADLACDDSQKADLLNETFINPDKPMRRHLYKKSTLRFDRHGRRMIAQVLDVYAQCITGGTLSAQVLPMDITPTA